MLLIKCPQCQASYRLAESLYRRKAAGYGVVITCRRCKTQIHLDEGSLPPPAGDADKAAAETSEGDVTASPGPATPAAPTPAAPTPVASKSEEIPTNPTGFPKPDPANPDDDTTEAAVDALPNVPQVAPKPAAPRPGGAPRPGAGATPPRRGATLLGIPPPANAPAALVAKPEAPARQAPPRKEAVGDGWKPKLVALSPGLLGVETAMKGAPPGAKAPPGPPQPARASGTDLDDEAAPDSVIPLSAGSVELLDSSVDAPPPDSLDSADYVSVPAPAAPAPSPNAPEAKGKRLPHPPAAPHPPHPKAPARETNGAELPSETSAPKVKDLVLESSPLPLSQKKGDDKPRRRQQSGDLTDDFLSSDLSFDAGAPALAPPDAGALTRAPVSSRPSATSTAPRAGTSTKAPVSKTSPSEKKSSGRGVVVLLVMAAFGGAGYVLQHRATTPEPPKPEPQAAANAVPTDQPAERPAETAAPPAETAAPAPAASAAAAAEAAPEPSVTATPPGQAAPAATQAAAAVKTPKPSTASTSETAATATTAKPTATPKAAATETAAPATPAVVEPRGSVGTDPFDVAAARSALDASAAQAASCRKEGDPSGVAVVTITFSQTGRVTTANISGPPFQATPTGGCIASTMRKTRVPAFAGEMVTVRKTVTIQ